MLTNADYGILAILLNFAKDHSYLNSIQNFFKPCVSLKTAEILNWFSAFTFRLIEEKIKLKNQYSLGVFLMHF